MGTTGSLAAIVRPAQRSEAENVLADAEAILRGVEARMSTWLADSEMGQFNEAQAGDAVHLSPESLQVLRQAQEAYGQTDATFDITCRPLVELWRRAEQRGSPPTEAELANARAASNWQTVALTKTAAVKKSATTQLDLGGIAKGYAIDCAIKRLRQAGLPGGMVDIGGDLVCFGCPPSGQCWSVDVQDPAGPGQLAKLHIQSGAVCTSGNYARYAEIAGRRYSHIIDPRNGQPTDSSLSVTVIGPTAMTADIWATALSVLGSEGLPQLPDGLEALIVEGAKRNHQITCTPGFCERLTEPLPANLAVLPTNTQ
jgi:thiamine biosynthesis lipoprotein